MRRLPDKSGDEWRTSTTLDKIKFGNVYIVEILLKREIICTRRAKATRPVGAIPHSVPEGRGNSCKYEL